MVVAHDVSQHAVELSTCEQWFLDTYHAIGSVGVLVLKSLTYLVLKDERERVQISRETLARRCGRSIRTVSRAVAKLKTLSLIEAEQPPPQGFDCWEPNLYRLTALGRHMAALLGTGGNSPDLSARDIPVPPVPIESFNTNSEKKTSEPKMAHAEIIEEMPIETPVVEPIRQAAPSCGSDLEPVIQALERADARRFAHLRDWILAKLRAGVSRRHLREALEALQVNLDRVQSWAGWVQSRLEDMAKAERIAEQRRLAALAEAHRWQEQRKAWAEERERNPLPSGALWQLFQAERAALRV
jgi:hypothetical protein